jgi:uncharacterized sporulation protein YeaH/YhbH (DUF444 family)
MTPSPQQAGNWYELFSRGARDWLRHNDKVREAVRGKLPDLISGPDLITGPGQRSVQVPVRMLEHAHFRLAEGRSSAGAGQGPAQPGDLLLPAPEPGMGRGAGGNEDGAISLLLELSVDDIVDWLWEEFRLPQLRPTSATVLDQQELVREGWDKRGARSRLDRRRTVKEAIKRRAIQPHPAAFTNEDLRFRQLRLRPRPSSKAVVFFVIDVSASMTALERRMAKTFFFFALQGLRRRYQSVEPRFLAHTTHAWEFSEAEFFQVSGAGGTIASSAFRLALALLDEKYGAGGYNCYLFYASDGENFTEDRAAASAALGQLAQQLNYLGYAETLPGVPRSLETEMHRLFGELERQGRPVASSVMTANEDIWSAVRKFFVHQADAEQA